MFCLATLHSITDGWTDDIIMLIADHTTFSKKWKVKGRTILIKHHKVLHGRKPTERITRDLAGMHRPEVHVK